MSAPHAETEPDLRDRAASLVEPIAITPGTRIGRYVVLSKLGAGGMGVVLAAYDPQLDRKVALKVLHPSREHKEREARRLLREAMAMARLTHPNVITVHDVGEHEKLVYISMELVEGGTLEHKLAQRPPWPEVLELFIAAGRGLAAAHAKGLVHRDFKPENVMVGEDGRVRVMDFGLAHDAVTDSGTATPSSPDAPVPIAMKRSMDTHAGRVAGTPGFIAPELHRGEPADPRSDQFAFGVALYEGLFGERPFVGETIFALAASTMAGQVREISAKSAVPGWVRRIVLRTLAVNPIDRFPTMDALLDALAQHDVRRQRRRIAIAVGGVLGLVGGAAGTGLFLAQRAQARCERDADAITASWNDDIRARTRAGFTTDAPAFAPIAFDKSAEWIDRWTAAWHDARREVCEAATIHETLTPSLEARALACLDERRRVLDGVIAQLAVGGEAITFAAVEATSNLPAISACSDEHSLRRFPEDAVVDEVT
ncbi:MAG TPA: serine/threonine-protein kinase, partial [Nannocystaceae bacterium]|nr:serine/threonine-protein kinase [Nannocystaceae bacterium]